MNKTVRREFEVAFSKNSQPVVFRIVKYVLLGISLYLFWGSKYLWTTLLILFAIALFLHFWYRYKTEGWTKSYGMWNYEKNKSKLE